MQPKSHILTYLLSRIPAAALNLASVAIFTRIAGADGYGTFLLIAAWTYVIQCTLCRWICDAFFACYREDRQHEFIATATWLHVAANIMAWAVLLLLALLGVIGFVEACALAIMVAGVSTYELAFEIRRTRLEASAASAVLLIRSFLMLVLGTLAIEISGTPMSLPFAVGAAYLLSAVPTIIHYWPSFSLVPDRETRDSIIAFGWPLIFATGTAVVAQNIDRIVLGHFSPPSSLGAYGALADLMKQGFFIFGEAISASLIALAKRRSMDGDAVGARAALAEAFRSMVALIVFGSIAVLMFEDIILRVFLGPELRDIASTLIHILLMASAFVLLRTFYFGQIVFFTSSSRLQLIVSVIQVIITGALAVPFVITWGALGAGAALLSGQILSCVLFAFAGRTGFSLPLPLGDAALIIVSGVAVWFIHAAAAQMVTCRLCLASADIALLAVGTAIITLHYDLFSSRFLVSKLRRTTSTDGR